MPSAPTYKGDGALVSVASPGFSVTVPFGTGGASPDVGDITLILVETNGSDGGVAAPAGWSHVANSPQVANGATNPTTLSILWRRFEAGDTEPVLLRGSFNHIIARCLHFSGCKKVGNPWDNTAGNSLTSASTSISIPGLTTTRDNCLVVAVCSTGRDVTSSTEFTNVGTLGGWSNASLSNLTERIDSVSNTGDGGGFGAVTGVKATAGTVNTTTGTLAGSSCQGRICIALAPVANNGSAAIDAGAQVDAVGDVVHYGAIDAQVWTEEHVLGIVHHYGVVDVEAMSILLGSGQTQYYGATEFLAEAGDVSYGYSAPQGSAVLDAVSDVPAYGIRMSLGYSLVSAKAGILCIGRRPRIYYVLRSPRRNQLFASGKRNQAFVSRRRNQTLRSGGA